MENSYSPDCDGIIVLHIMKQQIMEILKIVLKKGGPTMAKQLTKEEIPKEW
jgi:hypothetical protein